MQDALLAGWSMRAVGMEYLPVGGGGYHWQVVDAAGRVHFVTVDDLDNKGWLGDGRDEVFAGLRQALGTAVTLREVAGLEFVVAPNRGVDASPVRRLDDRYAVSVYPRLAGRSYPFGPCPDSGVRAGALEMIIALHQATPAACAGARVSTPGFAGRSDLEGFVRDPARPWSAGPLSASAHSLVAPHARELAELVALFDRLVALSARTHAEPVITHGEPHPGNFMSVDGRLVLIDWDTAALAAPERDLWLFGTDVCDATERYEQITGRRLDPTALRLYELRWYLDDVASAVRMFRRPHRATADTDRWFEALPATLAQAAQWLDRLR